MKSTKEIINSIAIEASNSKAIAIADINIQVEEKARLVMGTLKVPEKWLGYFCKVYHNLSEGTIQNILEGARGADNPARYFCAASKYELKKIGK